MLNISFYLCYSCQKIVIGKLTCVGYQYLFFNIRIQILLYQFYCYVILDFTIKNSSFLLEIEKVACHLHLESLQETLNLH